jgi:AraC-like DNA-binding protein
MDTVVAALLGLIDTALGHRPAGLRVDLPVAPPPWAAQYTRFSPVEIRFDQPALAIHVPTAALRLACYGADASAHAAACRDCERALVELGDRSVADRVAQWLADAPPGPCPQLNDVALRCRVSPRTLMRRLAAEGTSFQALLDTSRKTRALWLLQHSPHSVEDIAAQLGYIDTSNFSRTLRRWYGLTPRALRRQDGPVGP